MNEDNVQKISKRIDELYELTTKANNAYHHWGGNYQALKDQIEDLKSIYMVFVL